MRVTTLHGKSLHVKTMEKFNIATILTHAYLYVFNTFNPHSSHWHRQQNNNLLEPEQPGQKTLKILFLLIIIKIVALPMAYNLTITHSW